MAADSMSVVVEHVKLLTDQKIIKRNGHLLGVAGDLCPEIKTLAKWFFAEGGVKPYPSAKFDLLVAGPDSLRLWDQAGDFSTLDLPFFAIGSGKEFAIGAMEAGASAVEAVRAAIKWCPTVGGSTMVRRL